MPGFVETTVYTSYGYLDALTAPYVAPYVEKVRNTVPLIDRAAKGAEEVMPSLISRVDEFTEPRIEKLRPMVSPRIEQVKEIATPYIDLGVKRYESVKTEGSKYYSQAMECKNTKKKEAQLFVEDKIALSKKVLCKKGYQVNQLFRVPATDNVQGLKFQGMMGKVASLLQKTECLVDKCLPAVPKGVEIEPEYDNSYLLPRIYLLAVSVQTRLLHATKTKFGLAMKTGKAKLEKTQYLVKEQMAVGISKAEAVMEPKVKQWKMFVDPKVKQLKGVVEPKLVQLKSKVTPKVQAFTKTVQYKQAKQAVCKGMALSVHACEKIIGKDKTKFLIQAVEIRIPVSWKTSPALPAKTPPAAALTPSRDTPSQASAGHRRSRSASQTLAVHSESEEDAEPSTILLSPEPHRSIDNSAEPQYETPVVSAVHSDAEPTPVVSTAHSDAESHYEDTVDDALGDEPGAKALPPAPDVVVPAHEKKIM
eukprot:gnl/MRDRNA2_/MRDRNA2_60015_c0_seq1.p1 gnl/MRDRNA2_/MRDRNA2_60015_c0~~gnl/MRDRNA2_/MRDRNA2_60015_c0_seq1.p1  ORF type:complete len:477 (-),score=115.32 gnl/MRDRNA2_/MRDRNA2_60015_c0_seq1:454-1884(-)